MYAVVKTGGKQYRVQEGDKIKLEKLDANAGDVLKLDSVLMVSDGKKVTVGQPLVEKACVEVKVLGQGRHRKVKIIKFRRRKHSMKQMGHRQYYTEVEVSKISQ